MAVREHGNRDPNLYRSVHNCPMSGLLLLEGEEGRGGLSPVNVSAQFGTSPPKAPERADTISNKAWFNATAGASATAIHRAPMVSSPGANLAR